MLLKTKTTIEHIIRSILDQKNSIMESRSDISHVAPHLLPGVKLTNDEKKRIKARWSQVTPIPVSRGYGYYLGLKCLDKFNPDYLPNAFYYPYIERVLNPLYWKRQLTHKGMFQMAYSIGVKHPVTLLRSYGGILFDKNYKPVLPKEAKTIIYGTNSSLLYKPATDSVQGNGIRLYNPEDFDELVQAILTERTFENRVDFVLQKIVEQSDETKVFNPSSLNCMRITTLNLNGRVSVCTRALKCGSKNSVVDNIGGGKGGVIVGVSANGVLNQFGFYGNGEKAEMHNGIAFHGYRINGYSKVEAAAMNLNQYVSRCKIIGWDMALDSKNEPVLIEGNVVYPGISLEQMCSGPLFGDRIDEVINFLKSAR